MSDTFIQLNSDGSGKKSHTFDQTIGGQTVHDEIIRVADQYLASYRIDQTGATWAANDHYLQIVAGASLVVMVRRLRVFQAVVASVAPTIVAAQIFRLTTVGTGGTTNAVDKLDETDAAAGATAMQIPTVKGTEGVRVDSFTFAPIQTMPAAGQPTLLYDSGEWTLGRGMKPIRIAAGAANGIAVKLTSTVTSVQLIMVADITEQNFG